MKKHKKTKEQKREKSELLPRSLACIAPRLTLECIERYELLICGCKKIEEYSQEETLLCTHSCRLRVKGAKLKIGFTGESKILLSGIISSIEFE